MKINANDERAVDSPRTRDALVQLLLQHGPQNAATLAARLNLSQPGVRRHLDALVDDGLVAARDQPSFAARRRGRPARVFALTDAGRASCPHSYDDLATAALRFLATDGGQAAVDSFARSRLEPLAARHSAAVAKPASQRARVGALASALSGEGYAASATPVASGDQICQHHCPVAHVAAEFPALCEAETELFARLLGTHVQRLATIAHGDGVCTTHVPATPPPRRTNNQLTGSDTSPERTSV